MEPSGSKEIVVVLLELSGWLEVASTEPAHANLGKLGGDVSGILTSSQCVESRVISSCVVDVRCDSVSSLEWSEHAESVVELRAKILGAQGRSSGGSPLLSLVTTNGVVSEE